MIVGLLGLLEPGWRRDLTAGTRAADLDVEPDVLRAAARALGDRARNTSPAHAAREWPACLVVAIARAAAAGDGNVWPAWHRACGLRLTRRSQTQWADAFRAAQALLAIAVDLAHDASHREEDARPRLEPFGSGVLIDGRPAVPDDFTARLLAFDENGEPTGPELPAEPVWLLHPADAELGADQPLRVVVTSRLPLTWHGWRLVQVDLRDVTWVELAGARHAVRGRLRPSLLRGAPVAGVTTRANAPVLAAPPRVLLPRGSGRWRVEVRRAGATISKVTADDGDWQPGQLWRRVPRPLLGELTITIAGADRVAKSGIRRTVTVAEGLTASFFPSPRLTTPDGLDPAEAVLSAAAGMTASPQAVPIPADQTTAHVSCVAGQFVQRLLVTPPHIRIRIEPEPGSGETATPWHHHGPLRLSTRQVWHGGALSIDLPGAERNPQVEVVSRKGAVLQVLDPTRQGLYPLRRMADTVTANGGATLRITHDGRAATIATITPPDNAPDPWLNHQPA